jgi:hypothetical protein
MSLVRTTGEFNLKSRALTHVRRPSQWLEDANASAAPEKEGGGGALYLIAGQVE